MIISQRYKTLKSNLRRFKKLLHFWKKIKYVKVIVMIVYFCKKAKRDIAIYCMQKAFIKTQTCIFLTELYMYCSY